MKYLLTLNFLLGVYKKVVDSGGSPDTTRDEWLKIIAYMHEKKWLHYGYEEGKIVAIVGAYRVKEFKETQEIPEKEEGINFYVQFTVSTAKDKNMIGSMLRGYLKEHPKVTKVGYYKRNQDKELTIIDLKKENKNEEKTRTTKSA